MFGTILIIHVVARSLQTHAPRMLLCNRVSRSEGSNHSQSFMSQLYLRSGTLHRELFHSMKMYANPPRSLEKDHTKIQSGPCQLFAGQPHAGKAAECFRIVRCTNQLFGHPGFHLTKTVRYPFHPPSVKPCHPSSQYHTTQQ